MYSTQKAITHDETQAITPPNLAPFSRQGQRKEKWSVSIHKGKEKLFAPFPIRLGGQSQ